MKEKFLSNSINLIKRYQNIDEDEIKKIEYGLEGLYLTLTKIVIIFLITSLLGIFKEVLLLLLFFNIIRFTGFGFHANKSSECLIISILLFVIIPLILLNINITKNSILLIGIIGTIYLLIYAPADTIKRPLPNKKKRHIRKAITVITSFTFTIVAFLLNSDVLSTLLIASIIVESTMVSPITYKIFGQPYRNYLNYNKA